MSPIYYFDNHFKDFFCRYPKISVFKNNNDDK